MSTNNNNNNNKMSLKGYHSPTISPRNHIIKSYSGFSQRGNPEISPEIAHNKDAFLMESDENTGSLFVCVMDGHGSDGHKITRYIQSHIAQYLFKHEQFLENIPMAIWDSIDRCELELNDSKYLSAYISAYLY